MIDHHHTSTRILAPDRARKLAAQSAFLGRIIQGAGAFVCAASVVGLCYAASVAGIAAGADLPNAYRIAALATFAASIIGVGVGVGMIVRVQRDIANDRRRGLL